MTLNLEEPLAIAESEPVTLDVAGAERINIRSDVYPTLDPDNDVGAWTSEEMNLLADEADRIISQGESDED